jgi:hypothetical protein
MIIRNNDFWNKLGSDSEVNNSERGTDMAWSRPGIYKAYRAAKFGNGVDIPNLGGAGAVDYIVGSGFNYSPNIFISDFWVIPDKNVVNGVVQGGSGTAFRHGYFGVNFDSDNDFMSFGSFGSDIGESQFFTRINGTSYVYSITTGFNMTAGSLYHICLVLDRGGMADGSDTVRIYLDRVEIFSSTTVPANQSLTTSDFHIGNGINNSAIFTLDFQYDGVIDNFKYGGTFQTNNISERKIKRVLYNNKNEAFPQDYIGVI